MTIIFRNSDRMELGCSRDTYTEGDGKLKLFSVTAVIEIHTQERMVNDHYSTCM